MNAYEPHVRRRGYFLSESGSDPDSIENDSAEGIYTFRVSRPRRARKVVAAASGRPQRHRAAVSSHVSRSDEKNAESAVRSEISTGTHRP
jgi:hypothetical protein